MIAIAHKIVDNAPPNTFYPRLAFIILFGCKYKTVKH